MKTADLMVSCGSAPDMQYATGFETPDAYVYMGTAEKRLVIVSRLERDRAEKSVKPGVDVFCDEDISGKKSSGFSGIVQAAARKFGIGSFRVPSDFPVGLADALRRAGLVVTPEEGCFFPQREWKTPDEVLHISEALRLAEQAVTHAREVLGSCSVSDDGVLMLEGEIFTSEHLRKEIDLVLAGGGAMATGTIAASGIRAACPHDCGGGAIRAGEPIVMDVFPKMLSHGYWGDLTRTAVKGKASDTVKRAFNAVVRARDMAEKMLRPGVIPAEVHRAAEELMARAGFPTGRREDGSFYGFFHGLGHGVGLDIHETPHINLRGTSPLRGGEVVTVEPGLYDAAWGGIRMEDMVYITPEGAERLTSISDDLEIE